MPGCQLPPPLRPGDLLYAIAPSSPLLTGEERGGRDGDRDRVNRSIEIWRSRGFQVEVDRNLEDRHGYLAGTDAQRRSRLDAALKDSRCRGILCARGGYGAARLLETWDWPGFATGRSLSLAGNGDGLLSPKWLVGFSDVTALLWSLARQGVAGVHGPMLTTLAEEPDWAIDRLFDCVTGNPLPPLAGRGWGGGAAIGPLFPGNLAVATSLLGTPAQPLLSGAIVAFEDVGEAPYRLDRLLTQWRTSGALGLVAGVALGQFTDCNPPARRPSASAEELLRDRLEDLGLPVVSGLPFGHESGNAALPVGGLARLDGDRGTLEIL